MKRAIDLGGAAFLMLVLSPLLVCLALLVKCSSSGPVFYRSARLGQHGKLFGMWKFRTMVQNADQLRTKLRQQTGQHHQLFKLAHDPRVTPIGAWLRKTSLDELPQLMNVLCGEMSLIGPRPLIADDYAAFDAAFTNKRLSVLPGMTGIWQVSGRSSLTTQQLIDLETHYIDFWSVVDDIRILVATIPAVLRCRGAM